MLENHISVDGNRERKKEEKKEKCQQHERTETVLRNVKTEGKDKDFEGPFCVNEYEFFTWIRVTMIWYELKNCMIRLWYLEDSYSNRMEERLTGEQHGNKK